GTAIGIAAIGIAGIDHAADSITVARTAVDVGDPHLAALAIALGFVAAGIDRVGVVVAVAIAVVIAVALAVMVERGDDRGDPAKDGDAGNDVARVDAVIVLVVPVLRLRRAGGSNGQRGGDSSTGEKLGQGLHGILQTQKMLGFPDLGRPFARVAMTAF